VKCCKVRREGFFGSATCAGECAGLPADKGKKGFAEGPLQTVQFDGEFCFNFFARNNSVSQLLARSTDASRNEALGPHIVSADTCTSEHNFVTHIMHMNMMCGGLEPFIVSADTCTYGHTSIVTHIMYVCMMCSRFDCELDTYIVSADNRTYGHSSIVSACTRSIPQDTPLSRHTSCTCT